MSRFGGTRLKQFIVIENRKYQVGKFFNYTPRNGELREILRREKFWQLKMIIVLLNEVEMFQ